MLLFLHLSFVLQSCKKEIENDHINAIGAYFDSKNEPESFVRIFYSQIASGDRSRIWESLSDTTKPLSEAIEIVQSIDDLPPRLQKSIHLTLLDVCAIPPASNLQVKKGNQSDLDSINNMKLNYAR